jgi:hypothetical protein
MVMKKIMQTARVGFMFLIAFAMFASCKKKSVLVIPTVEAHFTFKERGAYLVTEPDTKFLVPFGITTVAKEDVTINVSVTTTTGAVEGTHYTIASKRVTIPAGKAVGFLEIRALFPPYESRERKDELVFKIESSSSVSAISTNNQYLLSISGDYDVETLLGDYNKTNEVLGSNVYGPYKTKISSVKRLTATTAEIVVENIFDNVPTPWKPIVFKLDWTDPSDFIATLNQQSGIGDASSFLGPTYAGQDISVRAFSGQNGTFSFNPNKIVLVMQLGVTGTGAWVTVPYTVTMER